tara:strand:+ start:2111 stop:2350 length:240 start_codon:yes stop_codon:yes gene_type:complete
MTLFEALSKRYQYEQLVSHRKSYDLPNYLSDIDSLKYFINSGYKNNRFRKNFNEAMTLAKEILHHYEQSVASLGKQLER